jgi:hypothetical protein
MVLPTTTVPPAASLQSGVPIQTSTPNQPQQVVIQTPTIAVASEAETHSKALEKQAHDLGYTSQVHAGKRYFCRVDTPTGSRLRETVCVTPEALDEQLTAQSAGNAKLPSVSQCYAGPKGTTCMH